MLIALRPEGGSDIAVNWEGDYLRIAIVIKAAV